MEDFADVGKSWIMSDNERDSVGFLSIIRCMFL